ncbi:low molecular weight phosphatase family protein [Pontibacter russatus]|uniref:protein-tyrosine-phosphatase n=1 Tax=Pontibacter russatus TaxID=2694929 RepID=UPI001379FFDC|nr:protein-tyrosine-phosphatase [Pontibacter russatus]
MELYPPLNATVQELEQEFHLIQTERKQRLQQLTAYIQQKQAQDLPVQLNFICTHNSRRSHMAQLWGLAAATHYAIPYIACFSGGTEATAFNQNAVKAMQRLGFRIDKGSDAANPVYQACYAPNVPPAQVWSKVVTDAANPATAFAAIMTCTDADQNCPFVPGTELRLALPFEDPKAFDGTPEEEEKYLERARQIGRELLYAFHQLKKK